MNLDALSRHVEVDRRHVERQAHARDLWPRSTLAAVGGVLPPAPIAVAFPRNGVEVRVVLEWAAEHGVPVVPWGAGSGVAGAAAGREGALCLDLKRLHHIGAVEPGARAVDVGAGVLGQHLEDALERQGWATRHSPSSIWCSTVGGWAAGRSAGQFSSRYGKFEDMILGLRVETPTGGFGTGVWADGEEDLQDWVVGAEGALGVITDLRVRVVPFPKARWMRGYRVPTMEAAWSAMRRLLQGPRPPAALRLYDPVDTRLAGKGSATKSAKGEGSRWLSRVTELVAETPWLRRNALSLPLSLPRLVNQIAQGVSKGCVVIAGWEGEPGEVELAAQEGHRVLLEVGDDLGAEPGEHWYHHRHDVSYKLAPVFLHGGFADTMEVASLWSTLPALYREVRAALGRHGVVMAHCSHAYPEGCSIYFTFAGKGDLAVYDAAWEDALAAAARAGGTVAHHHGVGQLKQRAAALEYAGLGPHFHRLKRRLDPAAVLNPGRMFPEVVAPPRTLPPRRVDPVSRVATLPAQEPPAARDEALRREGFALRFPAPGPLAQHLRPPHAPWENPVIGASVEVGGELLVFADVPRSSAGPDPRRVWPAAAYRTLTVPIVPLGGERP